MDSQNVYDYTPEQAEMVRLYALKTSALVGRKYHTERLERLRFWLGLFDTLSTITASGAFVSLGFWKTPHGSELLSILVFAAAALAIARTAFRLSERVDQHGRLMYAWTEIFLDLDQVLATARRANGITDQIRAEMDFLCRR